MPNDLWLSGESYAGIYVPLLAKQIDTYNGDATSPLNMKGFMVGNGVTNWDYDTAPAYVNMGYWHSLYDTALYDQMQALQCNYGGLYMPNVTPECLDLYYDFLDYVEDVNIYDIFGICYGPYPHPQMYEEAPHL